MAIDHASSYGILPGLENMQAVIRQVALGAPDAIMLMKGPAERCFQALAGRIALILKCTTSSLFHPDRDIWIQSVEEAVGLGADAIAMAVTIGSADQPEHLRHLSQLIREADKAGLPVIAHSYPCGEKISAAERYTLKEVGYASRIAMEMGVDVVKTFYTGSEETFAEVVRLASPALVVAAGGPRLDSRADLMRMTRAVIGSGAAGVTFGRNVWQCDDIPGIIAELKAIVHSPAR
ncbi:MAG: hypothetical protein HXY20_13265 [Acidobacteria bacterium]|nr:hypothetical protein [Acidobacteriota bacterium]